MVDRTNRMDLNPENPHTALLKHLTTFKNYIEETPTMLKIMCFGGGLAMVLNGFWGLFNLDQAFDHPVYYLVNGYQVFFGVVTCVTELDEDWCTPQVHRWLHERQKWMHDWALALTLLWGRALFYVFQGTLACVSAKSLFSVGLVVGLWMVLCGLLCLNQHYMEHRRDSASGSTHAAPGGTGSMGRGHAHPNEEYIRVNP